MTYKKKNHTRCRNTRLSNLESLEKRELFAGDLGLATTAPAPEPSSDIASMAYLKWDGPRSSPPRATDTGKVTVEVSSGGESTGTSEYYLLDAANLSKAIQENPDLELSTLMGIDTEQDDSEVRVFKSQQGSCGNTFASHVSGGILAVQGTDSADRIRIDSVFRVWGRDYLRVTGSNGSTSHTAYYRAADINTVVIDACNGNDNVDVLNQLPNEVFVIHGGNGDDTISAQNGAGRFFLYGEDGHDVLNGSRFADELSGGKGRDRIDGGNGNDWIRGGGDVDTVFGGEGNDTIFGNDGNDVLRGGDDNDTIKGNAGFDWIYGDDGDDQLNGNWGNDWIYGGNGNDVIRGGDGDDQIYGNAGVNTLYGESGNDQIFGGHDSDRIFAGWGDDYVDAGHGNNEVHGDLGSDHIRSGSGHDTIYGGWGNDIVFAGGGSDRVFGGRGDDSINGEDGNDYLYGEEGDDFLDGGSGYDRLWGANTWLGGKTQKNRHRNGEWVRYM
ncbi:MAG: calcium-binding protein [Pirellulaceae bacterium]